MNFRLRFCASAAALVALAAALPAAAQFAKPEDAIDYRQSVMTVMGTHFGRLGAMVQGKVPFDAKAAAGQREHRTRDVHAAVLGVRARHRHGTATQRPRPTSGRTRPSSRLRARRLQDQAVKLDAAAKTGNLDLIKAAFGDTAKTCKNCHDNFREK